MRFLTGLILLTVSAVLGVALPAEDVPSKLPLNGPKAVTITDLSKIDILWSDTTGIRIAKPAVVGTGRLANQTTEDLAEECGSLGVLEVPEGADATLYRKCRDHPSSHSTAKLGPKTKRSDIYLPDDVSPANPLDEQIVKRDCWFGKSPGCSNDGWCYARCGCCDFVAGWWCWLARERGYGRWINCFRDSDCYVSDAGCGGGCSC